MKGPSTARKVTIIKQAWWKRIAVWLGALFVLQGILALRSPFGWQWWGYVAVAIGAVTFVVGWRQGVVVTDEGVEARRLARRKNRTANWTDIDKFDRELGPVAVLRNGTKLQLFDWAGDSEAVLERLEAERQTR